MPFLKINGAHLWYEDSGLGSEAVVFSHGLLMNHTMFERQVEMLKDSYRCVRFDHRGQGRSEVTESGYDIGFLAKDAAELIRQLGCGPCHFAGLSMGGFVGLELAIHFPELLRSLTLIETSADPEPRSSRFKYRLMAAFGRRFGFKPLLGRIMPLMFGRTFLDDPARTPDKAKWSEALLTADREGILRAATGVIERCGVHDQLGEIQTPTLILVGDEDHTTPLLRAQRMQNGIRGSQLAIIPRAGHSSTIEQPERVTAAMLDFMVGLGNRRAQ